MKKLGQKHYFVEGMGRGYLRFELLKVEKGNQGYIWIYKYCQTTRKVKYMLFGIVIIRNATLVALFKNYQSE